MVPSRSSDRTSRSPEWLATIVRTMARRRPGIGRGACRRDGTYDVRPSDLVETSGAGSGPTAASGPAFAEEPEVRHWRRRPPVLQQRDTHGDHGPVAFVGPHVEVTGVVGDDRAHDGQAQP